MNVERKLEELGLVLPQAPMIPPGVQIAFTWVRIRGNRAFVAGHSAQAPDGSFPGPFGRVPAEVSLEAARSAARATTLSMLGSLKRALGDLDRVVAWLMVHGMVNAEVGYAHTTQVINGCSELILQLYGAEAGSHARTAIGVSALPMDQAVVIAAEVEIA
jgi:enamine deaminase RidA (YjgF/YER057c/UK114 family)